MSRITGLVLPCLACLSLAAAEPMPAAFVRLKTSAGQVEKGGKITLRPGERMTMEAKVYGGRRAWCMEPEKYANMGRNTVIETRGEDGLSFSTGPGFKGVWKLEAETAAWYGQLGDGLKPDAGKNTATLTGPKNPGNYVLSVKAASNWHYDRYSQGNHVEQTEKNEAEASFTVVVEAVAGSWFSSANIVATGQPDDDLRFRLQNVQTLYDSVSQQLLDKKWDLARQGLASMKATLGNIKGRLDQLKRDKPGYACEIKFLGLPSDKAMQRLQALQKMTEQWKAMNLIASENAQKINQLLLNKQTSFSNNILKSVFKNYLDWGSGIPGPNDLFGAVPAKLQGLVIPSNILDWYTNAQEDASILKNQAQTIQQLSKLREFYLGRLKSFNEENRAIHDEINANQPAKEIDGQAQAMLSGTGFASWQPKR
jgi:hypothetical protein